MRKYIIIKADTNDADYVQSKNLIILLGFDLFIKSGNNIKSFLKKL